MFKSKHVYLSQILLIHTFLADYFLLLLVIRINTLPTVESVDMQKLTFDLYHDLYIYSSIVFLVKIAKVKYVPL